MARALDLWRAVSIVCTINLGYGILLVVTAISLLIIDPYFNESVRTAIALPIIIQPLVRQPSPFQFFLTFGFVVLSSGILHHPGGTLLAVGQLWLQTMVFPSIKAYILAEASDIEVLSEFGTGIVPFIYYGRTIICVKYGPGVLRFLCSFLYVL
jgi:hypothetical protein